jgi:hypothetical protein
MNDVEIMNSNRIMITIIASILIVAIASYSILFFTGQLESDSEVSESTYIEIYYRQYGGFVPPEKAELESHISNNGNVRVAWKNIEGEITEGFNDKISRDELEDLAELILDNDYFALDENYTSPNGGIIIDVGAADISVIIDSREKKIVIDPNIDEYLPQNLKTIIDKIRAIIQQTLDQDGSAPQNGKIVGRVEYEDGYPSEGFRIGIIEGTAPFPEISPITNEDGEFQFSAIPPGTFVVALYNYRGEIIEEKSVSVEEGSTSLMSFTVPSPHPSGSQFQRISWKITGGFAGINEELLIASDGLVLLLIDGSGVGSLRLNSSEQRELLDLLKIPIFNEGKNQSFKARPNAADFFSYIFTVTVQDNVIEVKWVDLWAAEDDLPEDLEDVNLFMQRVMLKIKESIDGLNGFEGIETQIAIEFLIQAPTFSYDGIDESIKIIDVRSLLSYPVQYIVTLQFDSRNAGYGDRSGQEVDTVITQHTAVIKIVNRTVISANLDNEWDEILQEKVPNGDVNQTISGKVSIGPLCPVEPCPDPQPDIYSSRKIILIPEEGEPLIFELKKDGSFEARVEPGLYDLDISDCDFLGCQSTLPIKVDVKQNEGLYVEIIIDTGIR